MREDWKAASFVMRTETMPTEKRRHKLFADRKIQGALLAHTTIYWFYCLFSVTLIAVCWIIFTKEPETSTELFTQLWLNCGPALLGSVLLLPLVMLDCLRLSNRFAGPMVRMQRVMRELAAGESPPTFSLRPGDYWTELADDMNIVLERVRQQDQNSQPTQPSAFTMTDVDQGKTQRALTESDSDAGVASPLVVPLDGDNTARSIYSELSI
jgi:hypothetical protein